MATFSIILGLLVIACVIALLNESRLSWRDSARHWRTFALGLVQDRLDENANRKRKLVEWDTPLKSERK